MNRYEYTIITNTCKGIKKEFISSSEAVSFFRKHWQEYIVKDFQNDDIVLKHISLSDCYNKIIARVCIKNGFFEVV